MKKLILMMLMAFGVAVTVHAQTPKKTATKLPKALAQKLSLTADQQTKVDAIMATKATRIDSLTASADAADTKKLHKKRKAINTEAEVKIGEVLTADQKKTYDDFKTAQQTKAKAKKDGTTAPATSTTPAM